MMHQGAGRGDNMEREIEPSVESTNEEKERNRIEGEDKTAEVTEAEEERKSQCITFKIKRPPADKFDHAGHAEAYPEVSLFSQWHVEQLLMNLEN